MRDRLGLDPMGWRLVGALLAVALTVLALHTVGTVLPHFFAGSGAGELVSPGWLVLATVIAFALAVVLSLYVSRRLVAPLHRIIEMAHAFAAGDHALRIPDFGRPEIAEFVDALNGAAAEVERSEEARRRLTADIAHELRTPLTALQAGLEELRDGLVPPVHSRLVALHDQATRLGRIVNDLAELSAAESANLVLNLGPIDLGEQAEVAVLMHQGALIAAGLDVRCDVVPGVDVLGDVDRLHQVVANLLANTGQYCRPGDRVVVRVRAGESHGLLEVVDTGPGLAAEELPHAFDRSWRGAASRGTSGSGLGLPIVRALVLAQGGEVAISSEPGHGTVVRILLPLDGAGTDGAHAPMAQNRPGPSRAEGGLRSRGG